MIPGMERNGMARTAFVTGGTGFIGINLIALLVDEG
jgi:nucleoside-diphosphate-sugar epimerase